MRRHSMFIAALGAVMLDSQREVVVIERPPRLDCDVPSSHDKRASAEAKRTKRREKRARERARNLARLGRGCDV